MRQRHRDRGSLLVTLVGGGMVNVGLVIGGGDRRWNIIHKSEKEVWM